MRVKMPLVRVHYKTLSSSERKVCGWQTVEAISSADAEKKVYSIFKKQKLPIVVTRTEVL